MLAQASMAQSSWERSGEQEGATQAAGSHLGLQPKQMKLLYGWDGLLWKVSCREVKSPPASLEQSVGEARAQPMKWANAGTASFLNIYTDCYIYI